jgi:hypothetical protein
MAAAMRDYVVKRGWTIAFEVENVGSGTGERPRRYRYKRGVLLEAVIIP